MRLVLMLVRDENKMQLVLVPENRHVPSRPGVTVLPVRRYLERASALRDAGDLDDTLSALEGIRCAAR